MGNKNKYLLWLCTVCASIIVAFYLLINTYQEKGYGLLFLLPLTYGILVFIFHHLVSQIPKNLGVTLIVGLFFVRMVLSPLMLCLGDYRVAILKNVENNTPYAILLICYEALIVFFVLFYLSKKYKKKDFGYGIKDQRIYSLNHRYKLVLVGILSLLIVCIVYTPELLKIYRSIFQITDELFANQEDTYIISKYGDTFFRKLSLVTGNYLMRASLIIFPAVLIIATSRSASKYWEKISFLFTLIPLFFIGGAIARSLIYFVELTMLRAMVYNKKFERKFLIMMFLAAVAIIAWWNFRSSLTGARSLVSSLSGRLNAYFSGVNIVSGTFNLDEDIVYRVRYFLYDFISTFPYGTTLFNISHETVQTFFNTCNNSYGQIPPTIGMGCYYFGPILAPVYSAVFATIAFKAGLKLGDKGHPIRYVRLLITIFQFSMGIVMYNIEITMIYFWTLIFPMYLMEKFARIGTPKPRKTGNVNTQSFRKCSTENIGLGGGK